MPATAKTIHRRLALPPANPTSNVTVDNSANPASVASATADDVEVELSFTEGRQIAGIVRSPDGLPLKGANIWVYRAQQVFAQLVSDDDGRFACPAPLSEPESLYILAWMAPADGVQWQARLDGVPDSAAALDLTLKLVGR